MKNPLLIIVISVIMLSGLILDANAQREVIIEGYDINVGGDIIAYRDVLGKAFDDDSAARRLDPNVVYILKRDHLYPNSTTIKNTFYLHMKAEEGPGFLPALVHVANSQGKYNRFLEAQADVFFENIQFENATPDGGIQVRSQRLYGTGTRGIFKGCVFYQDGGGAITAWDDSISIYAIDCFAHSIGRRGENNSNGRFVDTRMPTYADTVVIQNCTADFLNGSFLRSGSAIIGYLKIDHCTMMNGRTGNISANSAKELIITNNILMNAAMQGDVPSTNDPLDTNPDHFHACDINVDTIWDVSKLQIRNNNIFYTDDVKAMWAKYDTIYEPLKVDPLIQRTLGPDSVYTAFGEIINFTAVCPPPIAFIEAIIIDVTQSSFPNQLCLGSDTIGGTNSAGLFPDQVDASYETTSVSYSAADDGFPLGDLNWWPEMKARWANGESPVGIKKISNAQVKIYPNPASDRIVLNAGNRNRINFTIYNILGKEVYSKVSHGYDEMDISSLVKGMYIYRISDTRNSVIQSGKIMIDR